MDVFIKKWGKTMPSSAWSFCGKAGAKVIKNSWPWDIDAGHGRWNKRLVV